MPTTITGTDGVSQVQAGAVESGDLPAEAYQKNNILGTVSESGGVPTGAIIERGSNANGEYVKYADGTQICHTVQTLSARNTFGQGTFTSLYKTNLHDWIFPISFLEVPSVNGTTATNNSTADNRMGFFIFQVASTTTVNNMQGVYLADSSNSTIAKAHLTAIGHWY